jgi:hypothetical protein
MFVALFVLSSCDINVPPPAADSAEPVDEGNTQEGNPFGDDDAADDDGPPPEEQGQGQGGGGNGEGGGGEGQGGGGGGGGGGQGGGDNRPTAEDNDGDGYDGPQVGGDDCDDHDPAVNPGATESCANRRDDDCDGAVDGADEDCG